MDFRGFISVINLTFREREAESFVCFTQDQSGGYGDCVIFLHPNSSWHPETVANTYDCSSWIAENLSRSVFD